MNLKALEILKKILKEINDDNLFLSEDFVSNVDIRLSVMELEVLENRSCINCQHNEITKCKKLPSNDYSFEPTENFDCRHWSVKNK